MRTFIHCGLIALGFLVAGCSVSKEEAYHYTPLRAGEVPATLQGSKAAKDYDIFPDEIDGVEVYKGSWVDQGAAGARYDFMASVFALASDQPFNPEQQITLSPTSHNVRYVVRVADGFEHGAFTFQAHPGEHYQINGRLSGEILSVWVQDSQRRAVTSAQEYKIYLDYDAESGGMKTRIIRYGW